MPRRASRQNIGSLSRGETHEEEKEKEEEKRRRRAAKVEGKGDVERVWNTAESFPPPCTRRGGWKMRWKFRVAGSLPSRARDRLSLRVWPSLSGNLYLTTPGCTGRVAARGIADGKKVFPRSAPACLRFFGAWNLFSRLRCNFFPGRRMVGRGGEGIVSDDVLNFRGARFEKFRSWFDDDVENWNSNDWKNEREDECVCV